MFFFFNAPAPSEIYTLSLHDALPIFLRAEAVPERDVRQRVAVSVDERLVDRVRAELVRQRRRQRVDVEDQNRSEEHTSELQSRGHLVCRLLLEKKKKTSA